LAEEIMMIKEPSLLTGEELVHTQDGIRTFSTRCRGKVSGAIAIPFLTMWILFITNRRVHLATTSMSLFTIRKDFWFSDRYQEAGCNILKSVDGSRKLTLTVSAHSPLSPQRPVDIVMKFGFKESEQVASLIEEHMSSHPVA
jgi:hypothetical protein